mmetsp:Transcript_16379/g.33377  ORF Transcript_16379/g.33377 Transcript_16379/m.33377 type:complete len:620 (-) Transcript_16379:3296-5155(-)
MNEKEFGEKKGYVVSAGSVMDRSMDLSVDDLEPVWVRTLLQLWRRAGLDADECERRLQGLATRVNELYRACLVEAEAEINRMEQERDEVTEQVHRLRIELGNCEDQVSIVDTPNATLTEQLSSLRGELSELSAERDARAETLKKQHDSILQVWTCVLGEDVELLPSKYRDFNDNVSEAWASEIQNELRELDSIVVERKVFVQRVLRRIGLMLNSMGRTFSSSKIDLLALEADSLDPDQIGVGRAIVDLIQDRERQLAGEVQHREKTIREYREKCKSLHGKLSLPAQELDEFSAMHSSLTDDCLEAWKGKTRDLLRSEMERYKELVEAKRVEIDQLREELGIGPVDLPEGETVDDTLRIYEAALEDARRRAEVLRPIMTLARKREEIRAMRITLEREQQDPNRLLTRNVRHDPGKLLREEKMRKEIAHLPKVEAALRRNLEKHVEVFGSRFCLADGSDLLEQIDRDIRTDQEEKENARRQRAEERRARLAEESRFGSNPRTPISQKRGGSGGRTPNRPSNTTDQTKRAVRGPHPATQVGIALPRTPVPRILSYDTTEQEPDRAAPFHPESTTTTDSFNHAVSSPSSLASDHGDDDTANREPWPCEESPIPSRSASAIVSD